jgi:hypothetical protein
MIKNMGLPPWLSSGGDKIFCPLFCPGFGGGNITAAVNLLKPVLIQAVGRAVKNNMTI